MNKWKRSNFGGTKLRTSSGATLRLHNGGGGQAACIGPTGRTGLCAAALYVENIACQVPFDHPACPCAA